MRWNAPEDFQSYSPGRVSARNCLMWNRRRPTASCAGVCWNAPECAGVGHNLGTTSAANTNALRRRSPRPWPHHRDVAFPTRTPAAPGADGTAPPGAQQRACQRTAAPALRPRPAAAGTRSAPHFRFADGDLRVFAQQGVTNGRDLRSLKTRNQFASCCEHF